MDGESGEEKDGWLYA